MLVRLIGEITIMTSTDLLMEGVDLMVLGLGSVFVFLILLIGCISLMSRLVTRFLPGEMPLAAEPRRTASLSATSVDSETLAVIRDAVRQHRARRAS